MNTGPTQQNVPLPIDPETGAPLAPREQPGYYPGYSTLAQQDYWDQTTRQLILKRVQHVPPINFFNPVEERLLSAICARLLPQDDRTPDRRIPIVPFIDQRLHLGRIDGYRYEGMPPDRNAYRLGLHAIEQMARELHGDSFADLSLADQEDLLKSLHDGKPGAAQDIWNQLPVHRFWMLVLQDCVGIYYAHPWAWDEIGYGGPAYPRAYMRLEGGKPEPWEVEEQRYEWEAPPGSVSDAYELVGGEGEHHAPPGQGGTH
jgi:hypothetical protein